MSKLIVITADELENIFDARLRVALKDFTAQTQRQPENVPGQAAPPYVSKKKAGRLLGVCVISVDNAARSWKLKRHYVVISDRFARL